MSFSSEEVQGAAAGLWSEEGRILDTFLGGGTFNAMTQIDQETRINHGKSEKS